MSAALIRQFSLPAPLAMGAGHFKPWVEATRGETVWASAKPNLSLHGVCLEVIVSPAAELDSVVMLAWVERLLLEAKVLTPKHILAAVGTYLDGKNELPKDRVRVRLWNAI